MKKQVNWTNALSPRGLLAKAREAAFYAYAPYSGFQVGAALLFEDEQVLAACNVENASIGLSICAERNVVAAMVATQGALSRQNSIIASPCSGV